MLDFAAPEGFFGSSVASSDLSLDLGSSGMNAVYCSFERGQMSQDVALSATRMDLLDLSAPLQQNSAPVVRFRALSREHCENCTYSDIFT